MRTNPMESPNYSLRKVQENYGPFPNAESSQKISAVSNASKDWDRPIRDWKAALNQFVMLFDRVPV